ncbi:MAG TPA: hypothetical protein EYG91_00595 [Aquifex aeolicus]|nr:hypothetical protein [Aquifex aeolicus]
MKVLLVFHKDLEIEKDKVLKLTEVNYEFIRRKLGIDNLYASITEGFLEVFKRFPEICFINNTKGTLNFGVYKGLRKLKGDDILIIDAGKKLVEEKLKKLYVFDIPSLLIRGNKWEGLAYIPKKEVYYFIKSLERSFEKCIIETFKILRNSYGISYIISDIILKHDS